MIVRNGERLCDPNGHLRTSEDICAKERNDHTPWLLEVKTTGNEGRIVVRELLELIEECAARSVAQAEHAIA